MATNQAVGSSNLSGRAISNKISKIEEISGLCMANYQSRGN